METRFVVLNARLQADCPNKVWVSWNKFVYGVV